MDGWNLVTLILLALPVEYCPPNQAPREAWVSLRYYSAVLELCDPADDRWGQDYRQNLNWVRYQWQLARDAPPLADAVLFERHFAVAGDLLRLNQLYQAHLGRSPNYLLSEQAREQLDDVLRDTRWLEQVWSEIATAGNQAAYWSVRRVALQRLKELMGLENYYEGQVPPHVPLWRFAVWE